MKCVSAQRGLSLVEVMVALALAMILTLGLTQIFVANSQSFRMAEASSRVQETGRLATGFLAREIRNADYWGCLRDLTNLNSTLNDDSAFNVDALMRGLDVEDGVGAGGSDRLALGGVNGNSDIEVTFQPSQQAANLRVNESESFNDGDIVIVTNCKNGDVFEITDVKDANEVVVHNAGSSTGGVGNSTQKLSTNYNDDPNGARVFRPRSQRFYLQDNGGRRELVTDGVNVFGNLSGTGTYSSAVALLEDVQDFQVQLGVDSNGDDRVDSWEDSDGTAAQADSAIAIRYSLLIRSPDDNVTDGGVSYCYPGWLDCESDLTLLTQVAATDTFFYRVYTTTTSLRNRIGGG
ncbi:MAG: PilW family protein [Marinobacter sp.]|uniref:PilW family protein n=1 Tax=Marinobacter sp. TaxID=50741 RepID=UPI00299F3CB0|nr:PilW family protein [Marinobacter sp.]MDX1757272.1 PilW family protein [Marinobacter sp.]